MEPGRWNACPKWPTSSGAEDHPVNYRPAVQPSQERRPKATGHRGTRLTRVAKDSLTCHLTLNQVDPPTRGLLGVFTGRASTSPVCETRDSNWGSRSSEAIIYMMVTWACCARTSDAPRRGNEIRSPFFLGG